MIIVIFFSILLILIIHFPLLGVISTSNLQIGTNSLDYIVMSMLILLLSTLLTVVKNPPDSLLCLIGAFILTIGLLLKIGMDFVAFSFLIVYIGAVAILFLFVIILFNLNELFVEQGLHFVVKFGIGVSAYIIIDYIANLFHIDSLSSSVGTDLTNTIINTPSVLIDMRDVYIFTTTFYSYYWDFFIICGWLLLVAMLGAIAIALSEESSIERPVL